MVSYLIIKIYVGVMLKLGGYMLFLHSRSLVNTLEKRFAALYSIWKQIGSISCRIALIVFFEKIKTNTVRKCLSNVQKSAGKKQMRITF